MIRGSGPRSQSSLVTSPPVCVPSLTSPSYNLRPLSRHYILPPLPSSSAFPSLLSFFVSFSTGFFYIYFSFSFPFLPPVFLSFFLYLLSFRFGYTHQKHCILIHHLCILILRSSSLVSSPQVRVPLSVAMKEALFMVSLLVSLEECGDSTFSVSLGPRSLIGLRPKRTPVRRFQRVTDAFGFSSLLSHVPYHFF